MEEWNDDPQWGGTSDVAVRKTVDGLIYSSTAEAAWNRPLHERVEWVSNILLPSFIDMAVHHNGEKDADAFKRG